MSGRGIIGGVEAFIQPPLPAAAANGQGSRRAGAAAGARGLSPLALSMMGEAAAAPVIKPSGGGKKAAGGGGGGGGGAGAAVKPRGPSQPRKGGGGGGGNKGRGLSSYARKPQHPARKYNERKGLVVQVYQEAQREMRAGRLDKAEELFRRCLTMDRKDARSWLQLAQLANRRGRQEEARSYFAQVDGLVSD
jgi:tetratricopeptide (TPR) repeat protein